ncbi:MerR family transcriptional regulator [Clostridium botulinum]|nr:hypothetical protein RSJ10_930 [Clostridium botulinum]AUM98198.1 MerR family transcriptional regulator [Clostridium botulinum]MBN3354994.1 MerR family transcriptional regulator [Clostridium botulinum]QDY28007.1 MerR family transcriptional regulator [Clostridium botulinum]
MCYNFISKFEKGGNYFIKNYRTSDVAKIIEVHLNTILSYEKWEYISTILRSENI